MLPNSRLTAAMTVLLSWVTDYPEDKIIGTKRSNDCLYFFLLTPNLVFTENVTTAKILGTMLNHALIGFVYFSGGMPAAKKSLALKNFEKEDNIKVFVSHPYKILFVSCGSHSHLSYSLQG